MSVPQFTMSFTNSADRVERRRIVQCLDKQIWHYQLQRVKAYHPAVIVGKTVSEEDLEMRSVYNDDECKTTRWHSPSVDNYEAYFKVVQKKIHIKLVPHKGHFTVDAFIDKRHNWNTSADVSKPAKTPESIPALVNEVLGDVENKILRELKALKECFGRELKALKECFGEGFNIRDGWSNGEGTSYRVRLEGTDDWGFDITAEVHLDTIEKGDTTVHIKDISAFDLKSPQIRDRLVELMKMIALQAKMGETP